MLVVAASALAQRPLPGGPPNPGVPGGPPASQDRWVLQYKGTITWKPTQDVPRTLWRRQSYDSVAPDDVYPDSQINFQQSLVRGCGSISGTISVRLKWTGKTDPPSYPNYVVHPYASASTPGIDFPGNNFRGTANNGVVSITASNAEADSLRLVQPGKTRESETTWSLSASVPDDVHGTIGCAFDAHFDDRYARVKASSIPGEYFVKGADVPAVSTLYDDLWDGLIPKSESYIYKAPKVENPVSSVGANRREVRFVGLPEGYKDGPILMRSRLLGNMFYGDVSTLRIAPESYTFTDDLSGTTVSESLPSYGPGWDVESIGMVSAQGGQLFRSSQTGALSREGQLDYSEQVVLNYKWADGLEAESTLQLIFKEMFTNQRQIQAATIREGGIKAFAFVGGFASLGTVEWQPWEGGRSRRVRWGNEQLAYKAGTTVVAIVATALSLAQPEAAMIASLTGVGLSIGSPDSGEGDLTPDSLFATDNKLVKHVLSVSDDLKLFIEGKSNEQKMDILAPRMNWKAQYISEYGIDVYLRDQYEVQGYVGPALHKKVRPVPSPIASQAKKFIYEAQ